MNTHRTMMRWAFHSLVVSVALVALPSVRAAEPTNLDTLKAEVGRYIDSGEYDRQIAAVAADAGRWLEERVKTRKSSGEQLALVLDLDETLFSNVSLIRGQGFGYNRATWNEWVTEGKAPAIEPVLALYRKARQLGVDVLLITGRREKRDRAGTEKNLKAIGCDAYTRLIFKGDESKETSGNFKRRAREKLTAEGFVIIANVGDQRSDLDGGFAERTFKLPNPLYLSN